MRVTVDCCFFKYWIYGIAIILLTSCTTSQVTRDAASEIDQGYYRTQHMGGSVDIVDNYKRSSSQMQGAFLGGAAGAVTGLIYPTVGIFTGTVGGVIIGASYGKYLDAHTTLLDRLEAQGVKVIIIGDQVLLLIPTYRLFFEESYQLKNNAQYILPLLATYVSQMRNMSIKIAAYTNLGGGEQNNLSLSRQQARQVANYLWQTGINTRLLFAEGYGSICPIDSVDKEWAANENNRIEISFEKLPDERY